ncbi:Cytochrome P450 6k1 [Atta colombica]|uniref:Cytochrome P450 6k1 n=1 Tax=Atta colombica TaxID=520822 RepID=A0A151I2V3_9HYME|nr:Cytochrome P450 6k1 [Atta colombica]
MGLVSSKNYDAGTSVGGAPQDNLFNIDTMYKTLLRVHVGRTSLVSYFVCTHADILPTLSALLLPWSRGDFWGCGWTKRSIPASHGPEPPPATLPSAASPKADSRVTILNAQKEFASGANVVQGGIEFLTTPSTNNAEKPSKKIGEKSFSREGAQSLNIDIAPGSAAGPMEEGSPCPRYPLLQPVNKAPPPLSTPNMTDHLNYSNLFFIKNPAWKIIRTKLSPTFTSGKLKKMFELMLECGDNLDTYLESLKLEVLKVSNYKDIELDMKDLSSKFFMNIVSTTAYGLSVNNNHLAHKDLKRNDLINTLIELKGTYRDQDSEREFNKKKKRIKISALDGDDLLAQAAVFFIATTMAFILYELARHPEVNLKKKFCTRRNECTIFILFACQWYRLHRYHLDMVEILKMYPVLPFLDRIVLEKGIPIFISLLGVHYDPEVYLPFGDGLRMCISSRVGLLQSKLGIVILRKYEVEPCKYTKKHIFNSCKMGLITAYWGLDGMIILMTLIITAYFYMTRKFKYWKKRGILEITPIPFFGNFKECLFQKKSPAYFLKDIYDEMKGLPYVGFYVLDKPFLLVRDRKLVKNILVKDFNYFSDRYNTADPIDRIGYANLFFIKNPAWKVVRTKLTPFFTSGKMKKMFDLMLICVKNLDEYLDALELEGNGKTIEVRELTAKFATDIIGSTAYGLDVNSFKDPNAEFRKYGKMIFYYNTYRSFEMLAIFFLPTIVRLTRIKMFGKEPTDFMRKVFWETLTQRMKSGLKRNDLIDILLELKNNNNNDQNLKDFTFDGDDLLAQAASFFSAGFETSSTTTTFALYELAIQPEIQNTLRKEIFEALKKSNGKITYDMVWSLPYLDMVMSETLRMYPPLAYLNRIPNQTYKVPEFNLVIEKDTPVYISMLGLHYDPEYFPNPNKFDPERFNEENKRNRPSCVYFPFGEGPHSCIGNRFGLLQTKLTLLKILSKCEDVLMAQAISFFAAGFDTTAQPIVFTLYELALQPDIQNTLRKEIHQALNNFDGKITYDMIISLPYMDMVVSETLRKYPPLGFLNRNTMETYQIPNFNLVLEKDTPIYIPMLALHYDPKYFPNPEKFDPERFNEENKRNIPSCVYFPFGDGPHSCIGNRFALLMIKLILFKMLNKCEVTPCEKTIIPVIIDSAVALTGPLNGVIYLNMRKANTVTD